NPQFSHTEICTIDCFALRHQQLTEQRRCAHVHSFSRFSFNNKANRTPANNSSYPQHATSNTQHANVRHTASPAVSSDRRPSTASFLRRQELAQIRDCRNREPWNAAQACHLA